AHWGDVIVDTISRATKHKVRTKIGPAGPIHECDRGGPVEAVLELHAGYCSEKWLLSEGWWAEAFLAPSYRDLVRWSVEAVPWAVALHIAQHYWKRSESDKLFEKVFSVVFVSLLLLAGLALTPLIILLLAITLLLGAIPKLRPVILGAQGRLVATVG